MGNMLFLAKHVGRVGTSFPCVVGAAIKRTGWLQDRLDATVPLETQIVDIANQLSELDAEVDAIKDEEGHARIARLAPVCTALIIFRASLNDFHSQTLEDFARNVEQASTSAADALASSLEDGSFDPTGQGDLIAHIGELSYAFPEIVMFLGLQAKVTSKMAQGRQQALARQVRSRSEVLVKMAWDVAFDDIASEMEGLVSAAESAIGSDLRKEDISLVEAAAARIDSSAWVADTTEAARTSMNVMASLGKLCSQSSAIADLKRALEDSVALREAIATYEQTVDDTTIEKLVREEKYDMQALATVRSAAKALKVWSQKMGSAAGIDALRSRAIAIQARAKEVLLERSKRQLDEKRSLLEELLKPARTDDGRCWRAGLGKSPPWEAYCELAANSVLLLEPKKLAPALNAFQEALKKYTTLASTFNESESVNKVLLDKGHELCLETRRSLCAGAVTKLMTTTPSDKVTHHRALQAQLRLINAKDLRPHIDDILVTTLKKSIGFS